MTETEPEYHRPDPNSYQVNGNHYRGSLLQPWDFTIACGLDYLLGNVAKYILRFDRKGEAHEDLKKAAHYTAKFQSLCISDQQKRIDDIRDRSSMHTFALEKATTADEKVKRRLLRILLDQPDNKQAMNSVKYDLNLLADQYAPNQGEQK